MKSSTTPSEPYIGFLGFMLMLAKNPFNHVGMTQKAPYTPILVGLGPKLWSVTLKLCQRAYLSVPLYIHYEKILRATWYIFTSILKILHLT